jgi:hypothetical protein
MPALQTDSLYLSGLGLRVCSFQVGRIGSQVSFESFPIDQFGEMQFVSFCPEGGNFFL